VPGSVGLLEELAEAGRRVGDPARLLARTIRALDQHPVASLGDIYGEPDGMSLDSLARVGMLWHGSLLR
jgi:hypothetical protein